MKKDHAMTRLLLALLLALLAGPAAAAPFYVKQGGIGDGTTWDEASGDIVAIVAKASADIADGIADSVDIYVAKGTYALTRTIDLPAGVKLYGGFAGTEAPIDLDARGFTANETILSRDVTAGDFGIVSCADPTATPENTRLDGFTITGGKADDGGGMDISYASPTITNCTFTGNTANEDGGGMDISYASPTITNCTFTGNTANDGGGMFINNASPTITNCTFTNNTATSDEGGGMDISYASPTITNCTFTENEAGTGGGMHIWNSSPTITNCTFTKNTANKDGGGMDITCASPTIVNCTLVGNFATNKGNEVYIYGTTTFPASPNFVNTLLWTTGDPIHINYSGGNVGTVTLTNCAGPAGMTNVSVDISNWSDPVSTDVPVAGVTHTVYRVEENDALKALIGKGTLGGAPATDQLGATRNDPPDIGAVEHVHDFATAWMSDATSHWHECACGEKEDRAEHAFSDWAEKPATATEDGKKERSCTVCGYKETQTIPKTGGGDDTPDPGPTGDSGATLSAVGVPTTGGMAEVPLSGTATFELGTWFGEDRKPATPQSLTVYVDGKARGEVSVTNGRFVLPSIDDDEYELWVVATLPDGSTLKSDKLYVVAGRGTLSAPDLKASPTSAREGDRVTFDLGDWINKRVAVDPSEVRWILDGVDVTDLVLNGKLTVEAVDGGDGTMTLIVTATLPNGLTGTATVRVTVTPAPDEGDEEETPGTSGGGGCDAGLGVLALLALAATRRRR